MKVGRDHGAMGGGAFEQNLRLARDRAIKLGRNSNHLADCWSPD